MAEWIALSRSQHADKSYLPRQGYGFATNQPVANVLLAELPKLLPHYALGFIERGEGYQPVALLSLDGQNNLYLHPDGRWLGSYVPASLRGYPFTLASNEQGDKVFAIDADSLSDEPGEPLFDEQGNLTEKVAQTLDFLKQSEHNRQQTQQAVNTLSEAGVIETWPLQIERGDGQEPLKVNGLYRVSEQAMNALEADAYVALKGAPMALAHAQMLSMGQLSQLVERAKFHTQHAGAATPPENLDELFGDDDDLIFEFDS